MTIARVAVAERQSALVAREAKVHRLRKQMRLAEEREEAAVREELSAIAESPKASPVLEEFLLMPKGELNELEGTLQLPLDDWAQFSIVPNDLYWSLTLGTAAIVDENETPTKGSSL